MIMIIISNAFNNFGSPPEDLMGADKLFAEARFGSVKGPLKLGALRNWVALWVCGWISFSHLIIKKFEWKSIQQQETDYYLLSYSKLPDKHISSLWFQHSTKNHITHNIGKLLYNWNKII